ncbi:MAG: response regulator [Gemmatimonadales bacterium]|nr:response regulator [Gemmatimonadales bacterium]
MTIFELITPISYWVLVILWSIILGLYLVRMRNISARGGSIAVLLTILALDAFRTLFESLYFGLYFNSKFGFLPEFIGTTLGHSQYLFIPKLINIIAGVVVFALLVRRWIPREVAQEQRLIKELAASEEHKKLAITSSNLATWDWDIETGALITNERFAGILGYGVEEFEPTLSSWENRIHPDDKPYVMKELNEHLEGKSPLFETEHRLSHKSDKWVWVHELGRVIERDPEGKPVRACGTLLDITARKLDEEERFRTAEMYQHLLNSLKAGVVVHAADGSVQLANPAACRILGLTEEQMRGKELISPSWSFLRVDSSIMPETDFPVSQILMTKKPVHDLVVGVNRPDTVDVAWVLADGFPAFDDAGDIQQVVITFVDFTKRKLAEEEEARLLLETGERVKELACMFGVADSIHKRVSLEQVFQEVLLLIPPGWHYPEITRGRIRLGEQEFVSQPFEETKWRLSSDIIVEGEPRGAVEVFYMEERPALDEGPFLKEERRLIDGISHALSEAIEHQQTSRRREEAEVRLLEAQKMEAIGQLAGGVAHDLNNILQAVTGYSEMAMADLDPDQDMHKHIGEVLKAGGRGAVLVRQLLAFSRRQVLEMSDIDLNDLVRNLVKMVERVVGEHIQLEVLAGHQLGIVRADPGQIEQILMNLCVNARDAMPTGGTITIETENVRVDDEYCKDHPWTKPGRYVLLSVADTGCGMDEKILANIFEPFFTTKDVGKGTGLGLSTVYGLVKQHKGMVHVYSEVDNGTVFKVYLPLIERMASAVGANIEGPAHGGTETILLAEDDTTVLELAKALLEQAGYTVLAASDGEVAVRIFETHGKQIDLALLDVMMPKLGGKAVYQKVCKDWPGVRFLFASGYSMNAIHTNFVLNEGMLLIQKPYRRDTLLHRVRAVLDGVDGTAAKAAGPFPDEHLKSPDSARILLIEDDKVTRDVLKIILENAGHKVTEAANGVEGCHYYRQEATDIVITDIVMPEKEGLETIRELRRDFPHVKIIAISGGCRGTAEKYLHLAESLGADIKLKKPILSAELLDATSRLLQTRKPS